MRSFRKNLAILVIIATMFSMIPSFGILVNAYDTGDCLRVYSNPASKYNEDGYTGNGFIGGGTAYGIFTNPNAFLQNHAWERTFAKNMNAGDGVVHVPPGSLAGVNTKVTIGHGSYPNTTDLAAVVTYVENGETKTSPSYRFTGYHANGMQDNSFGGFTPQGQSVPIEIGIYPNIVSVNVYHIIASNETIHDYVQFDVMGPAGEAVLPEADYYIETDVLPNELGEMPPTPTPTIKPSPGTDTPTPSPVQPTTPPGEIQIGSKFNLYSNPQSPKNTQGGFGKSYLWAEKNGAYLENYSHERTFAKFLGRGDGVIHEPTLESLYHYNTKISVHYPVHRNAPDLAAVITYMENGEIKQSPAYRYTGYHYDDRQSADSGETRDVELGTYPNVINVNIYQIRDGREVMLDWVTFEVVGEAGNVIPPETDYSIEKKVMPNYRYGVPAPTSQPAASSPLPGATMEPLVTPAPIQDGPQVALGIGANLVLYPSDRDAISSAENAASFMNQGYGTTTYDTAAGGSVTCLSNYRTSAAGAVGIKAVFTPKEGLFSGVDTKVLLPAWMLTENGAGLAVDITYDGGTVVTEPIAYQYKWNGSPMQFVEFGPYTNLEAVTLRTTSASASAIVPVIFQVVNEQSDYEIPAFSWETYVKPNIATNYAAPGVLLPLPTPPVQSALRINEVCSTNTSGLQDKAGSYNDWIELYNDADQAIDLAGYMLSDKVDNPGKWLFPNGAVIPAKGFLTVFASGKHTTEYVDELHTNFSISKAGETITLRDSAGTLLSIMDLPALDDDTTLSRVPDGSSTLKVTKPTPGMTNNEAKELSTFVNKPDFSSESGFYTEDFQLTLSGQGNVYYTLDGSTPTLEAATGENPTTFLYQQPIPITRPAKLGSNLASIRYETCDYYPDGVDKAMIVRAAVIDSQGISSDVVTKTYFVDYDLAEKYNNVAVLSVVTDAANLYDEETGIFHYTSPNLHDGRTFERPAHLSVFEGDGTLVIDQGTGIRLRGMGSRPQKQKGLNFYARSEYGEKRFEYPLFQDSTKRTDGTVVQSYKSFCIKPGIQTATGMRFFDSALQSFSSELGAANQSSRPCVVFINGEYWGNYYMQERVSEEYVEDHYAVPSEDVILIKNNDPKGESTQDDLRLYNEERTWLINTDFNIEENYNLLAAKFDIESMMLYYAANLDGSNFDWGQWNFAAWRSRSVTSQPYQDGKWRFLMYDMDQAYMGDGTEGSADYAMLYLNNGSGHHPYVEAMQSNDSLRRLFANTILAVQDGAYNPMDVINHFIYKDDELRPLMPDTFERWGYSESDYNSGSHSIQHKFNNIVPRSVHYINRLKEHFGFTGNYVPLNVHVNGAAMGTVKINTINHDFTKGSYTSRFFTDLTSTLVAKPNPGYEFDHWEYSEGTVLSSDTDVQTYVTLASNGSKVKAVFKPMGEIPEPIVISTEKDLADMAAKVNDPQTNIVYGNKHYILNADIVLTDSFTPIGTANCPFTGTFDGQYYTLDSIRITSNPIQGQGLFGYVGQGGTVKNVGVTNITITATGVDGKNIGAIVGNNGGLIENCYSTGTLSGASTVGGITGNNNGGTVKNCYSLAEINSISSNTGSGIAWKTEANGQVMNCYSLITPVKKLETGGTVDSRTSIKTADEFADGTVTYLLNEDGQSAVWTDGDGKPVFKNGTYSADIKLRFFEGKVYIDAKVAVQGATLVLAAYKDGRMTDIRLITVNVNAGEVGQIEIPNGFTAQDGGTIKAMLLANTETIMPLAFYVVNR